MCIPVILPDHGGLGGYAKTKFSFLKICLRTLNEDEFKIIIYVKKSFVSVCIVNIFWGVCIENRHNKDIELIKKIHSLIQNMFFREKIELRFLGTLSMIDAFEIILCIHYCFKFILETQKTLSCFSEYFQNIPE